MRFSAKMSCGVLGLIALLVGCSSDGPTASGAASPLVGVWANSWNTVDMIDTAALTFGADGRLAETGVVSLIGSYVQDLKLTGTWSARADSVLLTWASSMQSKDSGKTWKPLNAGSPNHAYRWSVTGDTLRLQGYDTAALKNDTLVLHRVRY